MSSPCNSAEIAEKRRIALEKLNAKKASMQQHNAQPSTSSASVSKSPVPSGASTFLNSMKQSNVFYSRQATRDASHPYQKTAPTIVGTIKNISNTPKETLHSYSMLVGSSPKKTTNTNFGAYISCRVYMISPERFTVAPSGFHQQMVEIFKSIPSRSYDSHTRLWSFGLNDYKLLIERAELLKPAVSMGTIPKSVLKLASMPAKDTQYSVLSSIEPQLVGKLLPFQQYGVCYGIAQRGRLMICDEMGLGKTYQALAIAHYYRKSWPLLICTNASTRESWAKHVRDLLPSVPMARTLVLSNNQQYFGDVKILITSYNMMERQASLLFERNFGVLIYDESHMLKNNKAKCTVVADRLAKQAEHVILLSGTPALSRPLELFTQIQMVDRHFMSFKEFTSRYCDGKQSNFGWDATGQSNLEELNVVMKLRFMLRRTKADVLPDLADKSRETITLDPALIWLSNDIKDNLHAYTQDWASSKGRVRDEILFRFYAETAVVKKRAVCSYLKTLVKEKVKFIVFAHHLVMLDAIEECMEKLNMNYIRIDGSTRNEQRADYIDIFQTQDDCRVAILSLRACNSGITLTAAEIIVFAELDWNPSTLAQAESRAHRIGQEKQVVCRYLMASNTADDIIWDLLRSKQRVLNQAGIFCENLQEAAQTTAPTNLNKISSYFSPDTSRSSLNCSSCDNNSFTETTETDKAASKNQSQCPSTSCADAKVANSDIDKELKDIESLFADDDDDDTFSNLII